LFPLAILRAASSRTAKTLLAASSLAALAAAAARCAVERALSKKPAFGAGDDGTHALNDLSFTVPDGGFHGLLGPNGSGKSTLIGIITGLVRGPAGHVKVFGHDAVSDHRLARTMVGLAPQEVHLDRFLTAREVLSFHGRYFGMAKADANERADELLVAFDLEGKSGSRPNRLSGGMRRRLLIARALVHRPRLAILDEPTAGVDLELRHDLWKYLAALHQQERTTILLTTHYLEEAEALCDNIAMIRDGRIIAEGTVPELMTRFGGARLEEAYLAAMQEDRGQTP
jgi:ABC-2 type transport system ATP-binding protein